MKKLLPYSIKKKLDPEHFSIVSFMEFASGNIRPSDMILDAGAGSRPYERYFVHAQYESTDFEDIFHKPSKERHDFICSLDSIPRPDNYYDAIINTQVIEHVEYPQKMINEFYRVLKPGGKLFLTAPQGWGVHGAPYHFYNFTLYGLGSLFRNAGFGINFIRPRGGIFWYLAKRIKTMPSYIFRQYSYDEKGNFSPGLQAALLFPFYVLAKPFCNFIIPLLFFYLDKLDKSQDYTLGYACYCIKEPA